MRLLRSFQSPSIAYPGEPLHSRLAWFNDSDPQDKMHAMRAMIEAGSVDPVVHEAATEIVRGVQPRDHYAEAQAILSWCQQIRYVGEKMETFQEARYTLGHQSGDCDDQVIAFCSLAESILIPTRLEALGHGVPFDWTHIYARVGMPPRNPTSWVAAEVTMNVPLGWEPREYARAAHL